MLDKEISPEQHQKPENIWDRLEIKAPPNFETVYHQCSKESLDFVNTHGLHAGAHRLNDPAEVIAEKALPGHLKEEGATRMGSVFASLKPMPNYYGHTRKGENYVILEVMVDPKKAFVAHHDQWPGGGGLRPGREEVDEENAHQYWANCLRLDRYLEENGKLEANPTQDWPDGPEVIIPGGVEQKYIRVLAERNPHVGGNF